VPAVLQFGKFCNTYGWEWTTIVAQIAPRPLLFANSDKDPIYPMDGNRRVIGRLREVYGLYGKPGLVDDYVSKGGHDYRPDLRLAVFGWINRHLKNDTGPVKDADFTPLPGPQLRAFPEDKDIPADALNARIDETFVPRAEVRPPDRAGFAAWRVDLMKGLRERSFRGFPERVPAAQAPGRTEQSPAGGRLHTTEPGITVFLTDPVRAGDRDSGRGLLVVLNGGD
jgi:hypothetical protein